MLASLSPAEIEGKLTALLKENMRLKETLMQNNMAMKQQFNTLACWQEEVMRVQKSHKQKFAETRELINRLKDENAQLKLDVIAKMQSTSQVKSDASKFFRHSIELGIMTKSLICLFFLFLGK